jgi:hypothetical protein
MPSTPYKIASKSTNRFKSCTHLRSLNARNFGMVEATRLSSTDSRSPSMSSSPYKISSKSTNWFKSCAYLRTLNVLYFETVEGTGCNCKESRSYSMLPPPHKISSKSTKRFKSYWGVSLHPPQKFKRPPFWNGWSYEIKKCDIEVILNGSTCLPNFTKIHR